MAVLFTVLFGFVIYVATTFWREDENLAYRIRLLEEENEELLDEVDFLQEQIEELYTKAFALEEITDDLHKDK